MARGTAEPAISVRRRNLHSGEAPRCGGATPGRADPICVRQPECGLARAVPPLIKNASLASIMRVRSWAAPRSASLRQRSPGAKGSAVRVRAERCRSRVMPSSQVRHAPDFRREVWHRRRAPHRPNLQFDIFPAVTFVTIAAASLSLSAQRPLPAVVVRVCERPGGPRAAVGAGLPSTSVAKCSRGQSWTRKIATVTASDDKARHRAPQRHCPKPSDGR
jgi:hypothetical protein